MCCRLCFLGVSMRLCGFEGGWEKWVIALHHRVHDVSFQSIQVYHYYN